MTTNVIPPDGVCLWEHCRALRAHDATHFCVRHMPEPAADTEDSR